MASSVSNLESGTKTRTGLAALGVIALAGGLYCFRHDRRAMLAILAGTAAVVVVLILYALLLKISRRRRAAPLESAIVRNSGVLPRAASDPALRAALDDLRKKFEAGLAKFRSAGKDLYSLPWYLIVGEPGSGKTEAIRRCNVGFPPGLQDGAQGAGGTINMNWWFTNHAVLLDTAGRLVFQNAAPARGGEWDEFLRLLVKSRPNCPINGMLLVIPADTLITDTADDIEPKAVQIAQQLDHIQRTLGVRFPVFVIVTKCDRINGFREFFETLTDPQLQHQMLGWSNPESREEPFQPELLDQHLLAIRGRLLRRRQMFLVDPVHTQDPAKRRIEQVDALYTFPDAFVRIGPRLRRYLEMIFMPAEWSPRPLFLRGIYFTSSIRDGAALDAELAEAMQMPVASLKSDGRAWERERAYFLRDLFVNKIFREKGLVSRAANTISLQRRRKMLVIGTALCAVGALLYFSWVGAKTLNGSIGDQTRYWIAVNNSWKAHSSDWMLVQPAASGEWRYNGNQEIDVAGDRVTLAEFFAQAARLADRPIEVPWIFRPQQALRRDTNLRRIRACRKLIESSVLVPVVNAARQKLRSMRSENWSAAANETLEELIHLEAQQAGDAAPVPNLSDEPELRLDTLLQFVLPVGDYQLYKAQHREPLREAMASLYSKAVPPSARDWPPASLEAEADSSRSVIDGALKAQGEYYILRIQGHNPRLTDFKLVLKAVERFEQAEDAFIPIIEAAEAGPRTTEAFLRVHPELLALLHDVEAAQQVLDEAMARLQRDQPMEKPILKLYELEIDRDIDAASHAWDRLLVEIPKTPASETGANPTAPTHRHLQTVRQRLSDAVERLTVLRAEALPENSRNDMYRADRLYLSVARSPDAQGRRDYELLTQLYNGMRDNLISAGPRTPATGGHELTAAEITAEMKRIDTDAAETVQKFSALGALSAGNERLRTAVKVGQGLVQWCAEIRRERLRNSSANRS